MARLDVPFPNSYALSGGPVWTGQSLIPHGTVVVRNGRIVDCAPGNVAPADVPVHDVGGRLVAPGFVCGHHHFYSALATGVTVAPSACFAEVLAHMWWLLDDCLTLDDVRLSARWSLAQCARYGVTTVLDHHASYGAITGSLDAIADEIERAGLSGVVCFETSNRHGAAAAEQAIQENLAFAPRSRVKRLFGLHASFTLDDELLAEIQRVTPHDMGYHVHCAEDMVDVEHSGGSVVARFERFGILRPSTLLIHGVHLTPDELTRVADSGAALIHCVESNLHNGVGVCDVVAALARGVNVCAGTDGMHSSMPRSYAAAYLAARNLHRSPAVGFGETRAIYNNTQHLAGRYFDDTPGRLEVGARADIAVLDYIPRTPVMTENVWAHMLYGASPCPAYMTIAGGRVVYADGAVQWLDEQELAAECRTAAGALWERMGRK
jgi:cytosine/adenosine deaminase-related metal-dependent hydrolase